MSSVHCMHWYCTFYLWKKEWRQYRDKSMWRRQILSVVTGYFGATIILCVCVAGGMALCFVLCFDILYDRIVFNPPQRKKKYEEKKNSVLMEYASV